MGIKQEPLSPEAHTIRVFISSTFHDMQEERDHLVKFIFPALRQKCRERGLEFVDVDLRWGIPEEKKAEVLPICLDEIHRCRPYFIGLLGERYGWVPDEIDDELIETQEWLKEHKEKSVTELEILHGVLNDPDMKPLAFFYFRDEKKSEEVEKELAKQDGYQPEPTSSQEKLKLLKKKIEKSDYTPRHYANAKALGDHILKDLWAVIDKRFPEESTPSPLERERMDHEAFASSRFTAYVPKVAYYKRLDEHVSSEGPPLVLLGDSGSGKSALIANWAREYREKNPDDFMVLHFVGSTADSADYVSLLRRIMAEIQERYAPEGGETKDRLITPGSLEGIEKGDEIPTDPRKVVEAFPIWLANASARGRFILVIDALNQLEDRDNAPDLGWLPEHIPSNVRLILSTLPGRSLDALTERNWQTLTVAPVNHKERKEIITRYLKQYRKQLSDDRIECIVDAKQSANPLFLRTVLGELKIFGIHSRLDEQIDYYLNAQTIEELFDKVLGRWEADYDRERPHLVKDALSLIWASRRGLTENELTELLGKDGNPLPMTYWSPLFLAIEESLIVRFGLFNFFHDYLRQAVDKRYVDTKEKGRQLHRYLADYFDVKETDDRKAYELPWQLCEAEERERLKDCLVDLRLFGILAREEKRYELMDYWNKLGDRYDMAEAYRDVLRRYEETKPPADVLCLILINIANFIHITAHYDDALPPYERALEISEKELGKNHKYTAISLNNLGLLYRDMGKYDEALPLCQRALEIYEKVLGKDHPGTASFLNNLAVLYQSMGKYDEALALLKRSLKISEEVMGEYYSGTAASLVNLASLYRDMGSYEDALPLFKRALDIAERVLGKEHPDTATSLNNLAVLYRAMGNYKDALPLFKRSLEIRERVLGKDHPDTANGLNNLGLLYQAMGMYKEALPFYQRALKIAEKVLRKDYLSTATYLNNLASLYYTTEKYEKALPLFKRALKIREKMLEKDHPDIAQNLNNLGVLYQDMKMYEEALPPYKMALEIREKVLKKSHPDTATSLHNLASLYRITERYKESLTLFQRALNIRERVLKDDHPDVAASLNNLGLLYRDMGKYDEALPLLKKAMRISEKVLGKDNLYTATSLNSLARLYQDIGEYKEALPLFQRALEIRERVLGKNHPGITTALNNLAILYRDMGRYEDALPLFQRALNIRERVLEDDHPDVAASLNSLGLLYRDMGKYDEALPLYQKVLERSEKVLGKDHPATASFLNNLAGLYKDMGRHNEALALLKRALKIYKKVFGQEHQYTINIMTGLAYLYYQMKDYKHAQPLLEWLLSLFEKRLGKDHNHTKAIKILLNKLTEEY